MKPLVIDLFCGLGGWTEAFLAQGYRAVGFDIEAHDYGNGGYPGELVLRDIRSISGAELVATYGVPAVIVCSPPCQEFSYMAMPWSKAKEKRRKILASETEKARLCDLFHQCFRIQREVSEAAGHYVPMVVENVRGAQEWVGKARWNFGSFYLWGDVPALMPIPAKGQSMKCPNESWSPTRPSYTKDHSWKGEGNKTAGMNWSDQTKRGQDFTRIAGQQAEGEKGIPHRTTGHWTNPPEHEEKSDGHKLNGDWLGRDPVTGKRLLIGPRATGSKSKARKRASAEIAKIPPALATWIARTFKPKLA